MSPWRSSMTGALEYEDDGKSEPDDVIDLRPDQYEVIEAGTSDHHGGLEATATQSRYRCSRGFV